MKFTTLMLTAMACGVAFAAAAQERSAGQTYDAQTNWSALKAQIDMLLNQNKLIAASIDSLTTQVGGVDDKIDSIGNCGAQGKLWNGSTCVAVSAASPTNVTGKLVTKTFNLPGNWNGSFCAMGKGPAYCTSQGYDSQISCTNASYTGECGHDDCSPTYTTTLVCGKTVVNNN